MCGYAVPPVGPQVTCRVPWRVVGIGMCIRLMSSLDLHTYTYLRGRGWPHARSREAPAQPSQTRGRHAGRQSHLTSRDQQGIIIRPRPKDEEYAHPCRPFLSPDQHLHNNTMCRCWAQMYGPWPVGPLPPNREVAPSMVSAGATAPTSTGNRRAYRESCCLFLFTRGRYTWGGATQIKHLSHPARATTAIPSSTMRLVPGVYEAQASTPCN